MKWYDRVLRTVLQLVIAAPFTIAVNAWIATLRGAWVGIVQAAFTVAVGAVQNYMEERGWITPVLKGNNAPPE